MHSWTLVSLLGLFRGHVALEFDLEHFYASNQRGLELGVVGLLAVILANYVWGKAANEGFFRDFCRRSLPIFRLNFPLMGEAFLKSATVSDDPETVLGDPLLVDRLSATSLSFLFAGRKNVGFCSVNLFAKRRQNFMVNFVYSLGVAERDQVLLDVLLRPTGLPSGCLYVVKAKKEAWVKDKFDDVRMLCKRQSAEVLSNKGFVVLGENAQIAEVLLGTDGAEIFNFDGHFVESLEVTDCLNEELHAGINVKMQLNVGTGRSEDWAKINHKIGLFLALVDRLSAYIPSREILADLRENRGKFWAQLEKRKWHSPKRLEDRRKKMLEIQQ